MANRKKIMKLGLAATLALSGFSVMAQNAPTSLPPLLPTTQDALSSVQLNLSPEQIFLLKQIQDKMTQASAADPSGKPPKVQTRSVRVSLEPGAPIPELNIAPGFPSSITVVDAEGNPWPIDNFAGGSDRDIQVNRPTPKDEKNGLGASLVVLPVTNTGKYTPGGLSIYLKDMLTPIVLSYQGGKGVVDQRIELRVAKKGPMAQAPISLSGNELAQFDVNPALYRLLDGLAPDGAKKLKTSNQGVQAWSYKTSMYVKSQYPLLAGVRNGMKSGDGTYVYEAEPSSSLRLMAGSDIITVTVDF